MALNPTVTQHVEPAQSLTKNRREAPTNNRFFPREHGAYIVLIGSWMVGNIYVIHVDAFRSAIALTGSLAFFLLPNAYAIVKSQLRNDVPSITMLSVAAWIGVAALLLALTALRISPTLVRLLPPSLVLSAACATFKLYRARLATLSTVAFALLALAAPATAILNGSDDRELIMLSWILSAGFFCGSSMNVAIRLKGPHAKLGGAIYHTILITLWLTIAGGFPCFAAGLVGFLLNASRYLWIVRHQPGFSRTSLKRIGLQESIVTALFVASALLTGQH